MIYLWLKVLHIVAVTSWMAGLLYLPRLMVYHSACAVGSDSDALFKIMERRLLKAITTPAAVVSLFSGGFLVWQLNFPFDQVWLWLKLIAVAILLGSHMVMAGHVAEFGRGERTRSGRYFRVLNEVPTVLLIVIVTCVVVKPFAG